MIDSRTAGNDGTPAQLIRYQFTNHLGTSVLELDDAARIISYEEYYPFGSTSFQSVDSSREIPVKRYRYTGKERDEESGLYYHGARYYAPWLGRWTAADPMGIVNGPCLYAYAANNPIRLVDPSGKQQVGVDGDPTHQLLPNDSFARQAQARIADAMLKGLRVPSDQPKALQETSKNADLTTQAGSGQASSNTGIQPPTLPLADFGPKAAEFVPLSVPSLLPPPEPRLPSLEPPIQIPNAPPELRPGALIPPPPAPPEPTPPTVFSYPSGLTFDYPHFREI